jgi:hypothetical protein
MCHRYRLRLRLSSTECRRPPSRRRWCWIGPLATSGVSVAIRSTVGCSPTPESHSLMARHPGHVQVVTGGRGAQRTQQPLAPRGMMNSPRVARHIGAMSALVESGANLRQEFRWNLRQICDETRFEDRILLCGRQLRELFRSPDSLPHETTVPQVVISGAGTCLMLPGYGASPTS